MACAYAHTTTTPTLLSPHPIHTFTGQERDVSPLLPPRPPPGRPPAGAHHGSILGPLRRGPVGGKEEEKKRWGFSIHPYTHTHTINTYNKQEKVLKAEGVVLVEFYAAWCGHWYVFIYSLRSHLSLCPLTLPSLPAFPQQKPGARVGQSRDSLEGCGHRSSCGCFCCSITGAEIRRQGKEGREGGREIKGDIDLGALF